MPQLTMAISGMSCGGCVSRVKQALAAVPGARVDVLAVGSATVTYDEGVTTPDAIAEAVRSAGYQPVVAGAPTLAGAAVAAGGGCCGGGIGDGS